MKRATIILSMFCIAVMAVAGVLSARTAVLLSKKSHNHGLIKRDHYGNDANNQVHAFVTIDNDDAVAELAARGVLVNSRFGNVLTVTLPLCEVETMARLSSVKHVALEQRCVLCNDSALRMSHYPDAIYTFNGTSQHVYSGKKVVVGVIDVGVDFNHINFLDDEGNSRIVRAYLPSDSTGNHPVVDGMELPGSEYVTQEQIKALTTDDTSSGHGTHTAGTAAGSFVGNAYSGVAKGAQIVACAMPEESLTDANIANSVKYIFNYASQIGLPAVINMSIGSHDGAHDGSSMLCRLFDEVSGPGRICVVSAGNDGGVPMHISKTMTGDCDSLAMFLCNKSGGDAINGFSSLWSSSGAQHGVDLVIWDIKADSLVHRLNVPQYADLDSVYSVSSNNDSIFAKYFDGELYFAGTVEDNGCYHSIVETNFSCIDKSHYLLGTVYKAPAGDTLRGWTAYSLLYSSCSLDGWSSGTVSGSISDLATGDSTISVGAYCSTTSFIMMDGRTTVYASGKTPGEIADFSGYGPDTRGISRPSVVAPGCALASSMNRYYPVYSRPKYQVDVVEKDGESYPYGVGMGTSMSTPVVAGAVALMLEIDPSLSPSEILHILQDTSVRDEWVATDVEKWGAGKLDIDACVKYLLIKLDGDVNGDGVVSASDVTSLYNIILGISDKNIQRSDVNIDGATGSSDITKVYNKILGL